MTIELHHRLTGPVYLVFILLHLFWFLVEQNMRVCWKSLLERLFQSMEDELTEKLSNLVGMFETLMLLNMPLPNIISLMYGDTH